MGKDHSQFLNLTPPAEEVDYNLLSPYTVEDVTEGNIPPLLKKPAIGDTVDHPFIARCKAQCDVDKNRKVPRIMLDPWVNNKTIISSGSVFSYGTDCYYNILQNPQYTVYFPDKSLTHYEYQIDVNVTAMSGVVATIHNGTSLFLTDPFESIEVE